MLQVDVAAQVRNTFGKGAARTLRSAGLTPAVLYGPKTEPMALELDTRVFTRTLLDIQRRPAVVTLDIGGADKKNVLIKEVQTDPIKDTLTHADFYEIDLDESIQFAVHIEFQGTPAGVDAGGVLNVINDNVSLKGKPLDIPDLIAIDVSGLEIGDKLAFKDLEIPAGIELVADEDTTFVMVSSPSREVEEEVETETEAEADEEVAEEGSGEESN